MDIPCGNFSTLSLISKLFVNSSVSLICVDESSMENVTQVIERCTYTQENDSTDPLQNVDMCLPHYFIFKTKLVVLQPSLLSPPLCRGPTETTTLGIYISVPSLHDNIIHITHIIKLFCIKRYSHSYLFTYL